MTALTAPFSAEHSADPFGDWPQWRKDMGLGPHRGKDWNKLARGTPIPASGDGVVTWRTNYTDAEAEQTELGHRIVIGHPLGDGRTLYLGYSHLAANPVHALDAAVKHRQSVGLLGNSGSATTGDHLHQTASWSNGNPGTVPTIDPIQFFTGSATADEDITLITSGDDMTSTIVKIPDGAGHSLYLWNQQTGAVQWISDMHRAGLLGVFLPTAEFADARAFDSVREWYGKTLSTTPATAVAVDVAAIVKAVQEAIKSTPGATDAATIARAVDAALADNFAGIPKAVNDDAAARLAR